MAEQQRQDPRFKLTKAISERVRREFDRLEEEYAVQKKRETENLHNTLAEAIAEQKPSIETLLFVLEMLKFEALQGKYNQLFVNLSDRPPTELKAD